MHAPDDDAAALPSPPPDARTAAIAPDAPPVPPPPPVAGVRRFDRARAERVLADCRFPVDPKKPDPLLKGQVIDWGPVTRRERVIGTGADGERTMDMFEIQGARARYRLDGDSMAARLGNLDAEIGDLIVVCPYALPAAATVDKRELPPGWRTPSPPVYAFAPSVHPPATAGDLADRKPVHVADGALRNPATLPRGRHLLVWARPKAAPAAGTTRWDMGGWTLDAADLDGADLLAAGQHVWLVVDRPTLEDQRPVLHGVVARRRILD